MNIRPGRGLYISHYRTSREYSDYLFVKDVYAIQVPKQKQIYLEKDSLRHGEMVFQKMAVAFLFPIDL